MTLFKNKYRIESNRLKNWDYSSNAIYFLTICSSQRACIFGKVEDEKMILNENGAIIEAEILKSITIRQNWIFHNWIVMPNHIHLLIEIKDPIIPKFSYSTKTILPDDTDIELRNLYVSHNVKMTNLEMHNVEMHNVEMHSSASLPNAPNATNAPNIPTSVNQSNTKQLSRRPRSISSFVGGFKATVTFKINELNHQFEGSIWQSNFHDHIIKGHEEFKTIFYYIENNSKKWNEDTFNPKNAKK